LLIVYFLADGGREWAGVTNTGGTAVTNNMEVESFHVLHQSRRVVDVTGDS